MENSVNSHMRNVNFNVGILTPPDDHYKPVLFSPVKATKDFCKLNQDIYQEQKKVKKLNDKKTPKSVFVFLGLASLAPAFMLIKRLIKR